MARLKDVAAAIDQQAGHKLARSSVVMPLPLYEGQKYAVRVGVPDADKMDELIRLQEDENSSSDRQVEVACDLLNDSCRGLLARLEAGGDWEPLEHEDGRPVLFDEDFTAALDLVLPDGAQFTSGADVVRACWCVEREDGTIEVSRAALINVGMRLAAWMADTNAPVEGEIVEGLPGGRQSSGSPEPPSQA